MSSLINNESRSKKRTHDQLEETHATAPNNNPESAAGDRPSKKVAKMQVTNYSDSRQNRPSQGRQPAQASDEPRGDGEFQLKFVRKVETPVPESDPQIQCLKGGELNQDYKMTPMEKVYEQSIEELLADDEVKPQDVNGAKVQIKDLKNNSEITIPVNPFNLNCLKQFKDIEDDSLRTLLSTSSLLLQNQPLFNPLSNQLVKSPSDALPAKPIEEEPGFGEPEEEKASEEEGHKIVPQYMSEVINLDDKASLEEEDQDAVQTLDSKRMFHDSVKINNRIFCNQQVFVRKNSMNTTVSWMLYNHDATLFYNKQEPNWTNHCFTSPIFATSNGQCWQMKFMPKILMTTEEKTKSHFCLMAIPSEAEIKQGKWERRVSFSLWHHITKGKANLNEWNYVAEFDSEPDPSLPVGFLVDNFTSVQIKLESMRELKNDHQLCLGMNLEELPKESSIDPEFKGLVNEGTTCYINSLIQTLFFIRPFRNAIYKMPTIQQVDQEEIDDESGGTLAEQELKLNKSIPFCIQRIFYNLQEGVQESVRTHELLRAFGWSQQEQNIQQDVDEFSRKLADQLEQMMEKTEVEGTYNKLFMGKHESVIKCVDVESESKREETFNSLSLTVKESNSVEDSIRQYLAPEKLTGENQYQTENHGLQDAKKFIRFKSLPPVLQLQLNRYEFDFQFGSTVKNNKKFNFEEVLDLEPIISKAEGGRCIEHDSEAGEEEVVNRYHLHAILIHRGTFQFGHYFAFIKPRLDGKWFEFNDTRVEEIAGESAINKGKGGHNSLFKYCRNANSNSTDPGFQLIEQKFEQNANAYMLIYVREKERAQFMSDKLSLDQQIPSPLQEHFKQENLMFNTIMSDWEKTKSTHRRVVLFSEETAFKFNFDGPGFGKQAKVNDEMDSIGYFYHQMYVSGGIRINEFIRTLKDLFFPDDDNIALEDIWLYRIVQTAKTSKLKATVASFQQYCYKYKYDLRRFHDCPLFQMKPMTQKDYFGKKMDTVKSRLKNLIGQVNIYLTINPEKKQGHKFFRQVSKKETSEQLSHFTQLQEYIKKTDMDGGATLITQCQRLKDSQYRICQPPKTEPTFVKQSFERLSHIISKIRRHIFIEVTESMTIREETAYAELCALEGKEDVVHSDSDSVSSASKDEDNNLKKFPGFYTQNSKKLFKDEHIFNSKPKPSAEEDVEIADEEGPEDFSKSYLLLIKAFTPDKKLSFKGEVWTRLDRPFPQQKIAEKLGEEAGNLFFFLDNQCESCLKKQDTKNSSLGLNYFEGYGANYIQVTPDRSWVMSQVFDRKREAAFINVLCDPGVKTQEQAHSYYKQAYGRLVHRVDVNLCWLRDSNIFSSKLQQFIFSHQYEFNFLDDTDSILQNISDYCLEEFNCEVKANQIQLFDKTNNVIPYVHIFQRSTLSEYPLFELLNTENYLNFRSLDVNLNTVDKGDMAKIQLFIHNSVQPYRKLYFIQLLRRNENLKNFKQEAITEIIKQHPEDVEILNETSTRTYIGAQIHRETNTVMSFLDLARSNGEDIIGKANELSVFEPIRPLFRLIQVDYSSLESLTTETQNDIFMGIFSLLSTQSQTIGSQFVIPMLKSKTTVGDMLKLVREKLKVIVEGPDPLLSRFDPSSNFSLFNTKYNYEYKDTRSSYDRQLVPERYNYFSKETQQFDLAEERYHEVVFASQLIDEVAFNSFPEVKHSLYPFIYFSLFTDLDILAA